MAAGIQGQDKDAIAFLKQALQIEPQLLQAAVFLGELLYRQGDLELAIKTYERALPGAPPSVAVGMRGRLTAWRDEASLPQNRDAIKDDRFTISFDGPVQQKLAARAASVLSAAFWRIGKALGAYPSAPINVILYSERQFHDITGAPEWSAGGFDGQIRLPVRGATQNLAEFDRVLTHELTHAMLKSIASAEPARVVERRARDVLRRTRHDPLGAASRRGQAVRATGGSADELREAELGAGA